MSNQELRYVQHPWYSRIEWSIFYAIIIVGALSVVYMLADKIRTHSLPSGQVQLSTPYTTYLLGEPITFTVKNNFNSPIYALNHCPDEPLGVYRRDGTQWVRLHAQSSSPCTDEERRVDIPAFSSQTASLAPWQSLFDSPGKYRLVVFIEYYNSLPYQDIQIIAKPKPIEHTTQSNITQSPSQPAQSSPAQQQRTEHEVTQPEQQNQDTNEPNDN